MGECLIESRPDHFPPPMGHSAHVHPSMSTAASVFACCHQLHLCNQSVHDVDDHSMLYSYIQIPLTYAAATPYVTQAFFAHACFHHAATAVPTAGPGEASGQHCGC